MQLLIGIIIGLVILVLLVVVHELGHAIAARRNGVKVKEFGVGFPPRAWGKKVKKSFLGTNVLFTINWLPLGGFVRLQGENDSATKKGDYGAATFWQKTKILLAGVMMNWIVAAVIFSILAVVGMPKIIDSQFEMPGDTRVTPGTVVIAEVVDGSAAATAGFEAGDTIVAVDDEAITHRQDFIDMTRERAGESVVVEYFRGGETEFADVRLGSNAAVGVFGAALGGEHTLTHSTWSAPIVGVVTTAQLSWETVRGVGELLGSLFAGLFQQLSFNQETREQGSQRVDTVADSVAGPIGILGVLFPAASQQGWTQLLLLTGVISLTLAVMNTLPIPALDGGRWFLSAIFRLLRKPLTKEREEAINGIGFLILMGLIVLITIGDVLKLAG